MINKKEMVLPFFSEGIDQGRIIKWFIKIGDKINEGDRLFEFETEKATIEVPSDYKGYLYKKLINENDEIQSGDPICEFDTFIILDLFANTENDFKLISDQINEFRNLGYLKEELIDILQLPNDISNNDILKHIREIKNTLPNKI